MRQVAADVCTRIQSPFALVVHDWSKISFGQSNSKVDLTQLTHASDVGYEMTTALLVNPDSGLPIAPLEIHLQTDDGVLSTRSPAPEDLPHLEQVLPSMEVSKSWKLQKPLVHVIDREADSVDHYRQWDAAGHKFLIRADDCRVRWNVSSYLLSEVIQNIKSRRQMRRVGPASYQGRAAQLWVAETSVVLDRPAKKNVKGRQYEQPGRPVELRFVVAEVRSESGKLPAQWKLLTNVSAEWASTEQLARCYYWRWNIESFFKLLKSHGQQMEKWGQQTGKAIARRLLIAAMACVQVWLLQADESPAAMEFRNVLVRLSGRQTKRTRPHTAPALLAGLWGLLSMLSTLEGISLAQLKRLAKQMPYLPSG